jgi:uncharacterized protein YfbU (UPF0304 family)
MNKDGRNHDASGRLKLEEMEPKFPGFDRKDEIDLYNYANYLIKREGQFPEHNHHLDSHGGHPNYHEMITTWEDWGKPNDLSDEQINKLLNDF